MNITTAEKKHGAARCTGTERTCLIDAVAAVIGRMKTLKKSGIKKLSNEMIEHYKTNGWDGSNDITVDMINDYIVRRHNLKLLSVGRQSDPLPVNNFANVWQQNEGCFIHIVEFVLPPGKPDKHAVVFIAEEKILIDNTPTKRPLVVEEKDYNAVRDANGTILRRKKAGTIATKVMKHFLSKDLAPKNDGTPVRVTTCSCHHTYKMVHV